MHPALPSASHDPRRLTRKARRLGLLVSLRSVYDSLPETRCDGCARCCFESPGVFYLEHLRLLDLLAAMPAVRRRDLLQRALRELLFSWVEPDRGCIFLEASRCTIYEGRPLACRLFGLSSPTDPEVMQREHRLAAEEEADRLSWLGVEVPEATLTRVVVSCDRVRARRGRLRRVDPDEVAEQVAALDARLLPEEVVRQEYSFLSLPDRLGAALFGADAVDLLRLQLLRRAGRGEPIEVLLAQVWEQVEERL
jgi:Fe-S-cluster containining protein